MSLKIAILTTNTPHHTYFVRELIKHYNDVTVFCETAKFKVPFFDVNHPFEDERNEHELKKNGVLCCPTAINGVNNLSDDLFHLKRVMI